MSKRRDIIMERETQRHVPGVWSLFTKKNDFIATCNICQNDYSYKSGTGNLKKHWDQKHADSNDIKVTHRDSDGADSDGEQDSSFLKSKSNPTWKYYEILDSDKFEANCKLCGETVAYETVSDLAKHVREHGEDPKDTDDDEEEVVEEIEIHDVKQRRKMSKMWQYFSVIDSKAKLAACIFCKRILTYAGTITNLKRHLFRKHPQIKQVLVSTNRKVYEMDSGTQYVEHDEKDPIEMDTVYLEELEESIDQVQEPQIAIKSPKKSFNKRPFVELQKEPIKRSRTLYTEPLPKQNEPRRSQMGTIDIFGQYIVSLLKEMPKSAAEQLQNEIIMKIFTKKAALDEQKANRCKITERLHRSSTERVPVDCDSHELHDDNVGCEVMVAGTTD